MGKETFFGWRRPCKISENCFSSLSVMYAHTKFEPAVRYIILGLDYLLFHFCFGYFYFLSRHYFAYFIHIHKNFNSTSHHFLDLQVFIPPILSNDNFFKQGCKIQEVVAPARGVTSIKFENCRIQEVVAPARGVTSIKSENPEIKKRCGDTVTALYCLYCRSNKGLQIENESVPR